MEIQDVSDSNPTMLAAQRFEKILSTIQSSCLNFHLQISPFSAIISLKKSLIKDKSGNFLLPPSRPSDLATQTQNIILEKKVKSLEHDLKTAVENCEALREKNKSLQREVKIKKEVS